MVQVLRLGSLRKVGVLKDVERLADGGAAGGRGRDRVDVEAAVAGLGGRLQLGAVGREVRGRQVAGAHHPVGGRVDGRLVHRADDVPARSPW